MVVRGRNRTELCKDEGFRCTVHVNTILFFSKNIQGAFD